MQAMPQVQASLSSFQVSEELHCLLHIQQSYCFDWVNNKLYYTLNTLHQTLHNTLSIHSKHAKCHKSLNSQNSLSLSLSLSPSMSLSHFHSRPSHNLPLFLSNQITWFTTYICDWLVWCLFPPIGKRVFKFFCLQILPACRHFHERSPFWLLLPTPNVQQVWRQCSRKSVADIKYHKSHFTWPINTVWKLVYSLKAAPIYTSEPRLTEAVSCYCSRIGLQYILLQYVGLVVDSQSL